MDKRTGKASAEPVSGPDADIATWRRGEGHPMKLWRQHHKVTLEKIEDLTGISRSSLSRIERYKQTPLIGAAQKIIVASQNALTPADFFG